MKKLFKSLSTYRAALVIGVLASGLANARAVTLGPTGNYYEVFASSGIAWSTAKALAEGMGGHLATITSAAEDEFINSLRVGAGLGEVWAGGYQNPLQLDPTQGWRWLNGEGVISGVNGGSTYSNWAPGEPNDYYGPYSESKLAVGLFGNSTWNDEVNLGNIAGYVVEIPGNGNSVPEASSALAVVFALGFGGFLRKRFCSAE